MIGAVGGEAVRLLEGTKMHLLAGLAFSVEADGLDLDDVVRLLLQVPEDTGPTGGVDLADEALHVSVLPLGFGKRDEKGIGRRGDQDDHTQIPTLGVTL